MSKTIFSIESGTFCLTLDDPAKKVDTATPDDYQTTGTTDSFTCQVTSSALTATPNSTTETIPATMCEAGEQRTIVEATSYELDLTFLQDANVANGLNRFTFEHDTEVAYFYFGMGGDDGDEAPKAIGALRLQSGTIGGAMRTTLTSDLKLSVMGKPDVMFGTGTGCTPSDVVEGNWRAQLGLAPATQLMSVGAEEYDEGDESATTGEAE